MLVALPEHPPQQYTRPSQSVEDSSVQEFLDLQKSFLSRTIEMCSAINSFIVVADTHINRQVQPKDHSHADRY